MEEPPVLRDAITAIVNGEPVNWTSVESSRTDDSDGAVHRDLRTLSQIAAFYRTLNESSELASDAASVHGGPAPTQHGLAWGPLTLLERIGDGSFGVVYRAWDGRLEREVALKLLRPWQSKDVSHSRALQEGRLLARVRHQNVVTVYGADQIDDSVGIWMEFVHGRTLAALVRERDTLEVVEVVEIGAAVCRALAAVHRAGLVHRDVKAQNVMRDDEGRIVLMDFGAGEDIEAERTSSLAGTPAYLAPEVLNGLAATPQSDVYGVGVLLFHLLTGSYPFEAETIDELRAAHAEGRPANLRSLRPDTPPPLITAVECALASQPASRFATADAFEAALSSALRPRQSTSFVRNRRWLAWASAAAIVAGAVAIVGVARRNDRPLSAFHERDLVLVTAFDNRTGDPSLDGTIEYALEAELVQSRFLNVTPRVRAEDTLRLMGKPENTRIDLPIGREICVRDGGIHALLGGRIEKLGSTYLLTATLVEPGSGVTVAGVTEQAGSEEDLAPAVRRLSNAVRQRFGEDRSSVKQSNDRLEQVTTPSLKALRLYTESYHLGDRNEWKSALGLAKEAVREDPSFASARIWLAWALHNTGHPPSEFEPEAGMAVRLADHTTDWERDWIIGSYHELQRDYGEAVTSYERLLLRYPDHRWAIGNLAMDYRALGRVREGVDVIAHASDARPTNGQLAWTAVRTLFATRDFERVARYAARFDALTQVDPSRLRNAENATEEATSRFLPAYMTWSRKDVGATLSIVDRAVREPDLEKAARIAPELHDALLQQAFWFYLALGKSTAAQRTAAQTLDPDERHLYLAFSTVLTDDPRNARADLQALRVAVGPGETGARQWEAAAWLLTQAGMLDEAVKILNRWERLRGRTDVTELLYADLALAHNDVTNAVGVFTDVLNRPILVATPIYYRAVATLADALISSREYARASAIITKALSMRESETLQYNSAPFWMPLQTRLADLDRRAGRLGEAQRLEAELSDLLSLADPDFPLVRRLRRAALAAEK